MNAEHFVDISQPADAADETLDLAASRDRGRYAPGRSGNPKGRPRRINREQSAIESALAEFVTITDNKGKRKVTAATVIAKRLVQKAMAGEIAAIKQLKLEAPRFLEAGSRNPRQVRPEGLL